MTMTRRVAAAAAGVVLTASMAQAQSGAHYRKFQLGMTLAAVATSTGMRASQAAVVHQRPVLLQDLERRYPRSARVKDVKVKLRELQKISRDKRLCTS